MLRLEENIRTEGAIKTVQRIKEKYHELANNDVLIFHDKQLTHVTVSQFVVRLLLPKYSEGMDSILDKSNCRQALWEKVNSSVLSKRASSNGKRTKRVLGGEQFGRDQRSLRVPEERDEGPERHVLQHRREAPRLPRSLAETEQRPRKVSADISS